MGRRRIVTALLALVLALSGTVLLTRYVRGADDRALAGATTGPVLVVTRLIPQGTPVDQLASRVKTKKLPTLAVAPGALSNLAEFGGRVAAVDLQPGEQLLATRLVDPATLKKKSDEVVVPAGLQEVSVSLEPQRMLKGELAPGNLVGVMISLPKDDYLPAMTKLALEKVLVTRVDGSSTAAPADDGGGGGLASGGQSAPSTSTEKVLVTLAVDATSAQKIVYGAEHGSIWLTHQSADETAAAASPALTRKDVEQ